MIFDSHTHLQFDIFKKDFDELVFKLKENNIHLINVGSNVENSIESIKISEKYDFMYSSIGIHPVSILPQDKLYDEDESKKKTDNTKQIINEDFEKLILNEKVLAIGECGLDYSYFKFLNLSKEEENYFKEKQIDIFKKQIRLAKKYNKTLILHIRDLYKEALDILKQEEYTEKAIFHFYKGNMEITQEILKNPNWFFGFSGIITYSNACDENIKNIPLNRILIETDAPYVAPVPNRGKRNDPTNLKYMIQKISEIKDLPMKEVEEATFNNALAVYNLK